MLNNIVNNSDLAKHVKYLEVVNTQVLHWTHSLDHWDRCFYSPYVGDYDILVQPRNGIGSTFARSLRDSDDSADTQDLEKHYRRYRYWVDGGSEIERMLRSGTVPLVDLHKLPQLQSITTLDPRNVVSVPVRVWRVRGVPVPQPGNITYLDRTEIDSTVRHWGSRVENGNLEFAVGAIRQSAASLPSLIHHHSCELIRTWPNSPPLLHLQKLTLARPYQGVSENTVYHRSGMTVIAEGMHISRNRLVTWVKNLPNLHTLEITQSTDDYELINLFCLLGNQKYPNLKVLYLKGVVTTATDLQLFLSNHIDNLKFLTIDTPAVFTRDWDRLKEDITCMASPFCRLHLTESFKPMVSGHDKDGKIQSWWDNFHRRMEQDLII